jgi:hypothetical protein
MRAIEAAGWKEVTTYAEHSQGDPHKVLRMVRDAVHSTASRQGAESRVREQLHASEVLLSFLLCLEATYTRGTHRSGIEKARAEVLRGILRGVRSDYGNRGPSRERRSDEQLSGQSSDAVHQLSLVLARHAEAHRQAASDANASTDRVGKLRGYGNAFPPEVAATFIRAALEAA